MYIYSKLNNYEESINHYNKAIEIKPDYAEAYYNLGNLLKDTRKYDEAIINYRTVLLFNPTYTDTLQNLGFSFQKLAVMCRRLSPQPSHCKANLA